MNRFQWCELDSNDLRSNDVFLLIWWGTYFYKLCNCQVFQEYPSTIKLFLISYIEGSIITNISV
jgi:hypothetical protein